MSSIGKRPATDVARVVPVGKASRGVGGKSVPQHVAAAIRAAYRVTP